MQTLVDKLKPIFNKPRLDASDKTEIIKALVTAKLNTEKAHSQNSLAGSFHITSSRLAGALTNCLSELVAAGCLHSEQVNKITQEITTKMQQTKLQNTKFQI